MLVHLLILNYNGRRRLAECLPSVLRAAAGSRHHCHVAVIDNDSTDDSVAWLSEHFPEVGVIRRPNRGLCSFNDVVPSLEGPVAVLLNNDVTLDPQCIDPLVAPLIQRYPSEASPCFMTAPLCWRPDGRTYEGFKTAVCWRWGLVQATALYPGYEATVREPGWTASAGAALAVDRRKFAELGGFDPLYLPGRLEDLDFAFRGYLAGYHARYVPQAVMYHCGMATFGEVFGRDGCDRLALRNTLLFQWKNLRHPLHVVRQLLGLPARLALDVARAPWVPARRRWMFVRAVFGALRRLDQLRSMAYQAEGTAVGEWEYFRRFHPRRTAQTDAPGRCPANGKRAAGVAPADLPAYQARLDDFAIAGTQHVLLSSAGDALPGLSAANRRLT
jgi:N-acetylglucosaminyl-diphospho-decaprenol L-rhamnosyltransferase